MTKNIVHVRPDRTEYHAVQLGASDRPKRTTTHQMRGHFRKARVKPKYIVKEFPVTPDAHVPVGEFLASMFSTFHDSEVTQERHFPPFTLYLGNLWM